MTKIGQPERQTQNRIVRLFQQELGYRYLGDWQYDRVNSNIEEDILTAYLQRRGYSATEITKAIYELKSVANDFSDNLYNTNKNVYQKLRYGVNVKASISENSTTVHLIDWKNWERNDFAIAEEVTIKGNLTKRPDIVIYINGIALGILELKKGTVDITDGIRQNITNQQDQFIRPFFATVQFVFAGNDTQGLRYGTIKTPEKWYLNWKEDEEDNSRLLLDKYLLKLCDKERFLEIIHDFVLFDGGIKKLPRVHQYFGVKEAQQFVNRYEGGIIWHTQGSGKSITMVVLAKWILENKSNARVVILTDRTELDKQIEGVFKGVGETGIHKANSGKDLMFQLKQPTKRLICSLVHKFGKKDVANFNAFIKELEANPMDIAGELFVFVDECHRTQSGRLHKTMKTMLPNAVFIGFTGTPLLKKDKQTSMEVFGKYIHTYKFNQGVEDGIILDLVYEARDIDQRLSSQKRIDRWFDNKTKGLNDYQKSELKKKWGTMQNVLSSRSRMEKIVADIIFDFEDKPRLNDQRGNAMLVAHSIYEACRYYELFQRTEFKGKCAVITSYNPQSKDVAKEDTGANTETQKQFIYNLYSDILKNVQANRGQTKTETYEDKSKQKFKDEPANMKLLIVVSKLLTGFDAPSCTYLYIDKKMQDHGLFQAICRVNRLDSEDKMFGYIVDYKDLFKKVENAISVYTSELDDDTTGGTSEILLKDRLRIGKERLDDALEAIALLCEPVAMPKDTMDYIRYFCGNTEIAEELKAHEVQRTALYKKTVALIRAYANIKDELSEAGYSDHTILKLEKELKFYVNLRDEIKKASGETIDLKSYEADMRHLIDTYIQADEPETISPFGDMTLIDIIVNSGIADAINALPKGIKKNQGAIAETIENNVRRKIIKEHLINPAYFEKMSKLLDELIKERKAGAISYEEYLNKVVIITKQTEAGKNDDTPVSLKTAGLRALYDNLGKDEALALKIDAAVLGKRKADWRGTQSKEREIQRAIYHALLDYNQNNNEHQVAEKVPPYGIEKQVERIFDLIKNQKEY